jgi:meiosis-specific APC/C activator protein AMA1
LRVIGGGSNDRGIHFWHTISGACLNTINVSAQVTSLIWSNSHREIAATLGYANPDHPMRIVVYSWPKCQQIVSIPWQEEMRALYAVAYPGGPTISEGCRSRVVGEESEDDDDTRLLRELGAKDPRAKKKRVSEGCLVVAASDETVRFHEVWGEARRLGLNVKGVLGGSEILESMEGIENDGMLIR